MRYSARYLAVGLVAAVQLLFLLDYVLLMKGSVYSAGDSAEMSKHQLPSLPPNRATRYVLLTTQRSGSSWMCDMLNKQPGITCGQSGKKELMINWSYINNSCKKIWASGTTCEEKPNSTFQDWEDQFKREMDSACDNGESICGFKVRVVDPSGT